MVIEAFPLLSSVPEPSEVGPSLNVTVPDGVPAPPPDAATVADSVTHCPKTLGLGDVVRVASVGLLLTAKEVVGEVDAR